MKIDEALRQRALDDYGVLDTIPEPDYDDIVNLAAFICETPIAAISFIDRNRQWFKAKIGLDACETPRDQAFCAFAIETPGEVMVVQNATQDPRFASNPLVLGKPDIRFYAGAPMVTSSGMALGTLCVIGQEARSLSEAQIEALRRLSRQVMTLLEWRRLNLTLASVNARLAQQSLTDALTCIPNRRAFNDRIVEEIARAQRTGVPLCLLLIDIDHFKSYNDCFGHLAGDDALHKIAQMLIAGARPYDFVARYGGEEFALLLPNTTEEAAYGVAERLRQTVETAPFPNRQLTLSAGVACLARNSDARQFIQDADTRLYQAKANGRNLVRGGQINL